MAELTPEVLGNRWPDYSRFGATVPAFGFYARHVKGLTRRNMQLEAARSDSRLAIVFVDVTESRLEVSKKSPVLVTERLDYYEVAEGIYLPQGGRLTTNFMNLM